MINLIMRIKMIGML